MCRQVLQAAATAATAQSSPSMVHWLVSQQSARAKEATNHFLFLCGQSLALAKAPLRGYADSDYFSQLVSDAPISKLLVSNDGLYCFTMGKSDNSCLVQLSIDVNVIDQAFVPSDQALDRLKQKHESLYQSMRQYFALIQVQNGMDEVDDLVSIDNIGEICCALGFFPTEQEKEDMMNEIKYSKFASEGNMTTKIRYKLVKNKICVQTQF